VKAKRVLMLLGSVCLIVALATSLFATACVRKPEEVSYEWKIGTVMSERECATRAEAYFAKLVTERSGGRIKLASVPAGGLGNDRELFEACEKGDLPIVATCASTSLDPRFGAMYLPRLARDYEEADKIFYGDGIIAQIVAEIHAEHNQMVLSHNEIGFRGLNLRFPITSLEVVKGAKIRVPGIRPMQIFYEEMGAVTTTMSMADLMDALARGTVDGQENSLVTTFASGYFEFCPYYAELDYCYGTHQLVMNKDVFNSLPKDLQEIIVEAGIEAEEWCKDCYRSTLATAKKDAIAKWGVEFYELTPEDEAMVEAAAARAMERCKAELPAGIVDRIKEAVAKIR